MSRDRFLGLETRKTAAAGFTNPSTGCPKCSPSQRRRFRVNSCKTVEINPRTDGQTDRIFSLYTDKKSYCATYTEPVLIKILSKCIWNTNTKYIIINVFEIQIQIKYNECIWNTKYISKCIFKYKIQNTLALIFFKNLIKVNSMINKFWN